MADLSDSFDVFSQYNVSVRSQREERHERHGFLLKPLYKAQLSKLIHGSSHQPKFNPQTPLYLPHG